MEKNARDFFLKKAEDATKRAAHAKDPEEHARWLEIAEEYRRLSDLNPESGTQHV